MANEVVITDARYSKLLKDVKEIIKQGRLSAEKAVRQQVVETNWLIGRRLTEASLARKSSYSGSLIADLAEELGIHERKLYQCIAFFKQNKVNPRVQNLSWSHFRAVLRLKDKKARDWYLNNASKNKLTKERLEEKIRNRVFEASFQTSTSDSKLKRPIEPSFVYKAYLEKVIDGDTLLLKLDLGFQVFKEQRVRLAKIDTPSIDTKEGKKAFKHVRDLMGQLDFVIIKTSKIDLYGRYVADIFYMINENDRDKVFIKGNYLNQELVDLGLATKY